MLRMVSRGKKRQKTKPRVLKNRYFRDSKLSEYKFLKVLKGFADDLSASQAARESGVKLRSVNDIYVQLRFRISRDMWSAPTLFGGMGGELAQLVLNDLLNGIVTKLTGGSMHPKDIRNHLVDTARHIRTDLSRHLDNSSNIKSEIFSERAKQLWEERRAKRRMSTRKPEWSHVIELYARERTGTLNRPRSLEELVPLHEAVKQAMEIEDKTDARRTALAKKWKTFMQRHEHRSDNNKRFFDDLKRMLRRNPL